MMGKFGGVNRPPVTDGMTVKIKNVDGSQPFSFVGRVGTVTKTWPSSGLIRVKLDSPSVAYVDVTEWEVVEVVAVDDFRMRTAKAIFDLIAGEEDEFDRTDLRGLIRELGLENLAVTKKVRVSFDMEIPFMVDDDMTPVMLSERAAAHLRLSGFPVAASIRAELR